MLHLKASRVAVTQETGKGQQAGRTQGQEALGVTEAPGVLAASARRPLSQESKAAEP